MEKKLYRSATPGRTALSLAISVLLCASMLAAAFIFTCGMKAADGPQGANNEGPVMMIMLLVSLYFPALSFWDLRKVPGYRSYPNYYYADVCHSAYWVVGVTAGACVLAALLGLHLDVVQWGSAAIQLRDCSLCCGAGAVLTGILTAIHSRLPNLL